MDQGSHDSPLRIGSTRRTRGGAHNDNNTDPDFDRGPVSNARLFNAIIPSGPRKLAYGGGGGSGGAGSSVTGSVGGVERSGGGTNVLNSFDSATASLTPNATTLGVAGSAIDSHSGSPYKGRHIQTHDQANQTSPHSPQVSNQQLPPQQHHYHQQQQPFDSSSGGGAAVGGSVSGSGSMAGNSTAAGSSSRIQTVYELSVNLPTVEKLIGEIQSAYFDISRLEVKCLMLSKQIEENQHNILQTVQQTTGYYGDTPASRLRGFNTNQQQIPSEYWVEASFLELYQNQANLIDKYFDFMFLAYHPCGNSVTRGLVKKYKIPIRMWNKGIFKFLDILRAHMPKSQDLITKFIYHCFSLLTMLVDPPYESRHMWLEALGDLARFSMALGNISHGEWRGVSQYWYSRAANRSPGVGRLFHHCAVVCIYRLDSLFYFCKSLTTAQQFEPSRETILSLFESNQEGEANTPIALFIKLHQINFTQTQLDEFASVLSQVTASIMSRDRDLNDRDLKNRGAIIAYCNITALLGYGGNSASGFFYSQKQQQQQLQQQQPQQQQRDQSEQYQASGASKTSVVTASGLASSPSTAPSITPSTTPSTSPSTAPSVPSGSPRMAQQISFEMLRQFLTLPRHTALLHVIVWLHFLNSLTDDWEITLQLLMNEYFPACKFVRFLNDGLRSVLENILPENYNNNNKTKNTMQPVFQDYQDYSSDIILKRIAIWKKGYNHRSPTSEDSIELISSKLPGSEERGHYPLIRERPLPEELLLLGFVWSYKTVDNDWYAEYESSTTDEPFPGQAGKEELRPVREVRAIELALKLALSSNSWLGYHDGYFNLQGPFKAQDDDHMSDSEYVGSPD